MDAITLIISSTASSEYNQSAKVQCQSESAYWPDVLEGSVTLVLLSDMMNVKVVVYVLGGVFGEGGDLLVGSSPQTILRSLYPFLAWHGRHIIRHTSQRPNRCHDVIATSRNKRHLLACCSKEAPMAIVWTLDLKRALFPDLSMIFAFFPVWAGLSSTATTNGPDYDHSPQASRRSSQMARRGARWRWCLRSTPSQCRHCGA